jgi:ankyrin repeat protein
MSSTALNALHKWAAREEFDEYCDEAMRDNASLATELVFLRGESVAVRRVFVRVRGCPAYSRVGWVLRADVNHCMVCATPFSPEQGEGEGKESCCACGNVVCHRCGSDVAKVTELGDASDEVRVCSLCFWGQAEVGAVLRAAAPSLQFSPGSPMLKAAAATASPVRGSSSSTYTTPSNSSLRGTDAEELSASASAGQRSSCSALSACASVSSSDDEDDDPRRVLGCAGRKAAGAGAGRPLSPPVHEAKSDKSILKRRNSDIDMRNKDAGLAVEATRVLADHLLSLCEERGPRVLRDALMGHVLACVATFAVTDDFGKTPFLNDLYKSVVSHLFSHAETCASGAAAVVESYPMTWIHEQFPARTAEGRGSWLPLHWCGALSGADSSINAEHLNGILGEDRSLALLHRRGAAQEEVSVLSLAVAKARPSLAFVEALLSINRDTAAAADKDGALPLMYAAAWNEGPAVLLKLYDVYPKAVSATDSYGFTPLHFACYAGTLDAVKFLVAKHPKAVFSRNSSGALPLHGCAANVRYGSIDMFRALLELHREAVSAADSDGSLPLHIAAEFASIDVIRYLYDMYPSAASQQNDEGLLPMHMAGLRKQKSVDVLNLLTDFAKDNNTTALLT